MYRKTSYRASSYKHAAEQTVTNEPRKFGIIIRVCRVRFHGLPKLCGLTRYIVIAPQNNCSF